MDVMVNRYHVYINNINTFGVEQAISFFQIVLAAEQTVYVNQFLAITVAVLTVIGGIIGLNRQLKSQMDGYATKDYVDQKAKVMQEKINGIEKKHSDTEDDIKYIRSRIDKLIDLHLKEGK